MVSLLITREFSFIFNLVEEEINKVLVIVNKKWSKIHYLNTKATIKLHSTTEKNTKVENTLQSNPFHRDFKYDKGRDGYWDSSHTIIQLEDAVDYFFILFSKSKF